MAFEIQYADYCGEPHNELLRYIPEPGETEVIVPEGVVSIEKGAFQGCTELTSVILPDTLTDIGEKAFQGCRSLRDIRFPDPLNWIGKDAFADTAWLDAQPDLAVAGSILVRYKGNDTAFTVPDSIRAVGSGAFANCDFLERVTIPDTVENIFYSAFYHCTKLVSVRLPEGLKAIRFQTFNDCEALTDITIPDSVTEIGFGAFESCRELHRLTLPPGLRRIEDFTFFLSGIQYIRIPEGVEELLENAFSYSRLREIWLPSSLWSIGKDAFYSCWAQPHVHFNMEDRRLPIISENNFDEGATLHFACGGREAVLELESEWTEESCGGIREFLFRPSDHTFGLIRKPEHKLRLAMTFPEAGEKTALYLRRRMHKALPIMIDSDDAPALTRVLDLGLVPDKYIDRAIDYAITHTQNGGSPEMQTLLLRYKHQNGSFGGAGDQLKL